MMLLFLQNVFRYLGLMFTHFRGHSLCHFKRNFNITRTIFN